MGVGGVGREWFGFPGGTLDVTGFVVATREYGPGESIGSRKLFSGAVWARQSI